MNATAMHAAPATPALPPVKTLLAALVWLASRQRTRPDIRNLHAIVHQIQRLALHPDANSQDMQAGLRLAAGAQLDVTQWLACCLENETGVRH